MMTTQKMGELARHLLIEGADAQEIVDAMERPHKYADAQARAEATDGDVRHVKRDDQCVLHLGGTPITECVAH